MSYVISNKSVKYKKRVVVNSKGTSYDANCRCPVCGVYSYDGDVCIDCQKKYAVCKEK